MENALHNIIGIPLFWEYERVVLDFKSNKMHLIQKTKANKTKSISGITKSKQKKYSCEN